MGAAPAPAHHHLVAILEQVLDLKLSVGKSAVELLPQQHPALNIGRRAARDVSGEARRGKLAERGEVLLVHQVIDALRSGLQIVLGHRLIPGWSADVAERL